MVANANDFLVSARQAQKDAKASDKAFIKGLKESAILLTPDEAAGNYDTKRLLMTTLHGDVRPISYEDLKQFQHHARMLGKSFSGGITANDVINFSMSGDRGRANEQIHYAMPVFNKNGVVQFVTNASKDSDVKRHYVHVQFLNFQACVASPTPANKIVSEMIKGKLKISCDCMRNRYYFSYIQTVGKFKYGEQQLNYPKITNARLKGIACKHILRTMQTILKSPTFKAYAVKMIELARNNIEHKQASTKLKEMREMQEKMRKEYGKKKITTLDERRAARQAKPVNDLKAKAQEKAKAKAAQKATKAKQAAFNEAELSLKNLLKLGGINQQQYETMLNTLRNSK